MSLSILKAKAAKQVKIQKLPDWVSKKNTTFKIYTCINDLVDEKLEFIKTHKTISNYKRKKDYLIIPSEVARLAGIAATTLTVTSKYSKDVKSYIEQVNQDLIIKKDFIIKSRKNVLSSGSKQKKKSDLLIELKAIRSELDKIRKENAVDQVTEVLQNLSLPIKRHIGLDV